MVPLGSLLSSTEAVLTSLHTSGSLTVAVLTTISYSKFFVLVSCSFSLMLLPILAAAVENRIPAGPQTMSRKPCTPLALPCLAFVCFVCLALAVCFVCLALAVCPRGHLQRGVRPLTHPVVWCEQKQFSGSDLFMNYILYTLLSSPSVLVRVSFLMHVTMRLTP